MVDWVHPVPDTVHPVLESLPLGHPALDSKVVTVVAPMGRNAAVWTSINAIQVVGEVEGRGSQMEPASSMFAL